MKKEVIHLSDISSTNDYLQQQPTPMPDAMTVAVASHQTAGRGQGSNRWESEAGKNLLFSILTSPVSVPVAQQFVLSMAGALALKQVLDRYTGDITLKWPNDIYWRNRKISGTLIETSVGGKTLKRCIYGIGLNVNQRQFLSDAPNPVSLLNITGKETPLDLLLDEILQSFDHYYALAVGGKHDVIVTQYNAALFRRQELHTYKDAATGELFDAAIHHVGTDGLLHLVDSKGISRTYALKEVKFVI